MGILVYFHRKLFCIGLLLNFINSGLCSQTLHRVIRNYYSKNLFRTSYEISLRDLVNYKIEGKAMIKLERYC